VQTGPRASYLNQIRRFPRRHGLHHLLRPTMFVNAAIKDVMITLLEAIGW